MSFKIRKKKLAVTQYEVNFKNGEKVTFGFRKPTTYEMHSIGLDVADFQEAYQEIQIKSFPILKEFYKTKERLDELEALGDDLNDNTKEEIEELIHKVNKEVNELNKLQVFPNPDSFEAVKSWIKEMIVSSEGIQDEEGTEYNFKDLPEEDQNEVLGEIPLEHLKGIIEEIKKGVSLSPLELSK